MGAVRDRLEKRAKKQLAELEKVCRAASKAVAAVSRTSVELMLEGKPHPDSLGVASRMAEDLRTALDAVEQFRAHWRPGVGAQTASRQCADRMLQRLGHERPTPQSPSADETAPREPKDKVGSANCLLRGSNRGLPIVTILELLGAQGKSGTLRITTESETLSFEMRRGDIVRTSTDCPPADQLLGSILVDQGAVTREALDAFLAQHADATVRIGEALEEEEFVTRAQLRRALETQVQNCFHRVFAAEDATYFFYESDDSAAEQPDVEFNVTTLLLESARVSDEGGMPGPSPAELATDEVPPETSGWGAPHVP